MTQDDALKLLLHKRSSNFFVTGDAGSGKTHLIRRFLAESADSVRITASTGIAATILGGTTAHSFFGLGQGVGPDVVKDALRNRKAVRRIRTAHTVVIDEISMIGARTLGLIDEVCKAVRGKSNAFGGIRLIAVGDFNQLCPVSEAWAFTAPQWGHFSPIYLTDQYRTSDADLIECLKDIRGGDIFAETAKFLNARTLAAPEHAMRLLSHNKGVDEYNDACLARINSAEACFSTKYKWLEKRGNYFEHQRNFPIPPEIRLKVGAQVMLKKNLYNRNDCIDYVNGDLGIVESLDPDIVVVKRISDNRIFDLDITEFTIKDPDDGEPIISAYNFPMVLAYASTIHKSQGQTILGDVVMDLRKCFAPGQFYVSLSRAQRGSSIYLLGWNDKSVIVDASVRQYYKEISA